MWSISWRVLQFLLCQKLKQLRLTQIIIHDLLGFSLYRNIDAGYFVSNIEFEKYGRMYPFVSVEGSLTVVDNTLDGCFVSFGISNENLQMEYFHSTEGGFEDNLIKKTEDT